MRTSSDRAEALAKAAPKIREQDLDAINAVFEPYIFRVRRTGEIWTTCCRRHEHITKDQGPAFAAVLDAKHTAEPRGYLWGCSAGYHLHPHDDQEPVTCPFCVARATVKELGRCGERKNLFKWEAVLLLRQYRGSLWAFGLWANKDYEGGEAALTAPPEFDIARIYRFRPGRVETANCDYGTWYDYREMKELPKKLPLPIPEPFAGGRAYTVVGLTELEKTAWRYCGIERYKDSDFVHALVLCTQRPRHVELLLKAGMDWAVNDVFYHKRWNAEAIDWREPDAAAALGLDPVERKAFLQTSKSEVLLAGYKKLRRHGLRSGFETLARVKWATSREMSRKFVAACVSSRLTAEAALRYLDREIGRRKRKKLDLGVAIELWVDYIDGAKALGYDLKNPVFAMPKDLRVKHDQITAVAAEIRRQKQQTENAKREGERLAALCKRYTYYSNDYIIRPPAGAEEIVAEGEKLCHCVGGYAGRHVRGAVTILFLRSRKQPEKPLCTIEMRGNQIVQIHGYKNELSPCKANPKREDPRVLYRDILAPWLEWLEQGSKRDKLGRPKPLKKEKEVHAA